MQFSKLTVLCYAMLRCGRDTVQKTTEICWQMAAKNEHISEYLPNDIDLIIEIAFFLLYNSKTCEYFRLPVYPCHLVDDFRKLSHHTMLSGQCIFCRSNSILFDTMLYSVSHSEEMTMDKTEKNVLRKKCVIAFRLNLL